MAPDKADGCPVAYFLYAYYILSEAAQVVDQIGIISNGRLLFQGDPDPGADLEDFFTDIIINGGYK